MIRNCTYCGKSFETKSSRKHLCDGPHYAKCVICGKSFLITNKQINSGVKTCSSECRRTMISRKSKKDHPEFLEAKCEVCGKAFKIPYTLKHNMRRTCSKECMAELKRQTWRNFYGADNPMQVEKFKKKQSQSVLEHYGVDNPTKSKVIQDKIKQTSLKKYGTERPSQSKLVKSKITSTMSDRYGHMYPMQIEKFKNKAEKTCVDRYGVSNYSKSIKFLEETILDSSKCLEASSFKSNPREYIEDNFTNKPTLKELAEFVGMSETTVGQVILQNDLSDKIKYVFSNMEIEVFQFLHLLVGHEKVLRNCRSVITPYELDFYLPEYNFAIECNPTSTHNSTFVMFNHTNEPKPKNYHQMKTDLCDEKGIFLFHIYGYEWTHSKDVIKSMIANILVRNENKIYARNCTISEVTSFDSLKFLSENHRQGKVNSKINLGLYYNGKLVSLMTFSKLRHTIGTGNEDLSECYELVRFCSLKNTNVVGGASKLFKYFVSTYDPKQIRSFSDRSHTSGKLYSILGFQDIRHSDPGYVWVNLRDDKAYSRLNAQKQNIKKFLSDETIDLTRSETSIMAEHNFVQVFDSGTITWEWCKEQ